MHKLFLLLITLLVGCSTLISQGRTKPAEPLPQHFINISQISTPTFLLKNIYDNCVEYQIKETNFNFTYYQATPKKSSCIIIFNILKDSGHRIARLFAQPLLDNEINCIILDEEPFLNRTNIRSINKQNIQSSDNLCDYDEYFKNLMQNVSCIIKYWLPTNCNWNEKFGFLGVSMGGINVIGAMALNPNASLAIAIMAGGNNDDIFKFSEESLVTTNRQRLLKLYANKYTENGEKILYQDLRNLHFQVLDLAKYIDNRKIKLVISSKDVSVPTFTQINLYNALGQPETLICPCGHYTLIFYYFDIYRQIRKWTKSM